MEKIVNFILALIAGFLVVWIASMGFMFMTLKSKATNDPLATVKKAIFDTRTVVRLVTKGKTHCSGVVFDKNTILTAGHCITVDTISGPMLTGELIEIRTNDNRPRGIYGKALSADLRLDIGIIEGDFSALPAGKFNTTPEESVRERVAGFRYISCGFPKGKNLFCTPMIFIKNHGFCLAVKGVLIPGMSGGPTMLEDGTVIAINDAVEDDFSVVCPIYNVDMDK